MALSEVRCPECHGLNVVKYGKQPNGEQRYRCHDPACARKIFLLHYCHRPKAVVNRTRIIELALDGSDMREISRLLGLPLGDVSEVFQRISRLTAPPTGIRPHPENAPHVMAG